MKDSAWSLFEDVGRVQTCFLFQGCLRVSWLGKAKLFQNCKWNCLNHRLLWPLKSGQVQEIKNQDAVAYSPAVTFYIPATFLCCTDPGPTQGCKHVFCLHWCLQCVTNYKSQPHALGFTSRTSSDFEELHQCPTPQPCPGRDPAASGPWIHEAVTI